MAKQYQDIYKIKRSYEAIGSVMREHQAEITEILYSEGAPDFSDPGRLRLFGPDEYWGGADMDAWFRADVTVPAEMAGRDIWLELFTGHEGRWNAVNPQFLVFVNGREAQGLDSRHHNVIIATKAVAGEKLRVDFDAWSGAVPDIRHLQAINEKDAPSMFKVKVFTVNEGLFELYYDLKVPCEVAELLGGNDDALKILSGLRCAVDMLDLRAMGSGAFYQSAKDCHEYMKAEFYGKLCGWGGAANARCVGHTHIDVAWLWQYKHTMRKTERSFSTALSLLERYPDFTFMSSQPQLYQFVKDRRPDLYRRIKSMVREGRWEPEGGMWVEADCNLSSGEALIRQFVHGKRFFMDEFGVDAKMLWLPDVFGYSAALPQICKKCGIDYFMTIKISWNEVNKFPYDTFIWTGVDGTGILTHFIPSRDYGADKKAGGQNPYSTTYNGLLTPSQVMGGWERYQQRDISNEFLVTYGYGDGGGGTTWEMVEYLRRMGKGIPGCPVATPAKALDFFRELEKSVAGGPRLPEWKGELYLEFHRGTYTSVAKNKRNNRRSEQALQSLEAVSVMAGQADTAFEYPAVALEKHWKTMLLNQFHDVLPGSSIREVYEDTDAMYEELFRDAEERFEECKSLIAEAAGRDGDAVIVFNTLGFTRTAYCLAETPDRYEDGMSLYDKAGREMAVQKTHDGRLLFRAQDVPGMGWRAYTFKKSRAKLQPLTVEDDAAENDMIRVCFDEKGRICSLYDKTAGRELTKQGRPMNMLETYEDRPASHDAWDIAPYYIEKRYEVDGLAERRVIESGPLRVVIAQAYRYLSSEIRQNIVLYRGSKRVDFETEIDWKDENIVLKAAFPADILADKATYEIQYGATERPTHFNTSWEHAKFETCAQKWADLSEDGYGLSLLNDCKYGYAIHGDTMRLTLLRSPTSPCIGADQGRHVFTYSIFPHAGGWREAGTVREAYDLNVPLTAASAKGRNETGRDSAMLAASGSGHVNIEVLKAADDGNGVILRAYEAHGRRGPACIHTDLPCRAAYECDMLENNISAAEFHDGALSFGILPYEIKTFRIEP